MIETPHGKRLASGQHGTEGNREKNDFIKACASGGQAMAHALRRLLADYGGALQREGLSCLGRAEDARDLVQLTLIKAWRHCGSYRRESQLFPWLKAMLRHEAFNQLRSRRSELPLADEAGRVLPEVEAALRQLGDVELEEPAARLSRNQAQACFRRCAERFALEQPQAAAVLRWVADDGLGPAEIALLIRRTPGATREFISQCRKKARVYFGDWYRLVALRDSESLQ